MPIFWSDVYINKFIPKPACVFDSFDVQEVLGRQRQYPWTTREVLLNIYKTFNVI